MRKRLIVYSITAFVTAFFPLGLSLHQSQILLFVFTLFIGFFTFRTVSGDFFQRIIKSMLGVVAYVAICAAIVWSLVALQSWAIISLQ